MGGGAERTRGTYAPRASSGTCDTRRAHATRRANARYTARTHAHLFAAAEFDALPVDGDESRADRQQSPITWGVTDGGLHARDTSAPRLRGRRVLLEHDAQSRLGERALKRGSGLPWDGGLRAQATPARLMAACEYGGESAPRARPRVLAPGALVPHTPPPIIRSAANAPFLHALARPTADCLRTTRHPRPPLGAHPRCLLRVGDGAHDLDRRHKHNCHGAVGACDPSLRLLRRDVLKRQAVHRLEHRTERDPARGGRL